jgi:diguanylate cyclase (GGDEF)-like protein
MSFSSNVVINLYSILILAIILIHAIRSAEKDLLQQKLFMLTLYVTAFMLVMDIFSRFDGHPDTIYAALNHVGNFTIFLLSPVLPSLWLLYAYSQVNYAKGRFRRWLHLVCCVSAVNAVMLILSQFLGWYYTIGSDNVYHRGPLYWYPVSVTAALTALAFTLIVKNRKKVERKHFLSLFLFPIPPLICIALQILFYGTSLILNGAALSILIAYITIQNKRMNTDFLTGAYNRKGLELYMKQKINTSTESRTFAAILLDLDNFKSINDSFGHNTGDDVLVTSVNLLKTCIRSEDFIARYGGDEFFMILNISDLQDLEAVSCRIRRCVEDYNACGNAPYRLGVSMGYAVYDYCRHPTPEEFCEKLDQLMYEDKRVNKEKLLPNKSAAQCDTIVSGCLT